MIFFKNFLYLLRHHKAAALLNLAGLTVALASFMLIVMQVDYDRAMTGSTKTPTGFSGSNAVRQRTTPPSFHPGSATTFRPSNK